MKLFFGAYFYGIMSNKYFFITTYLALQINSINDRPSYVPIVIIFNVVQILFKFLFQTIGLVLYQKQRSIF